jgi:hypothetical protein
MPFVGDLTSPAIKVSTNVSYRQSGPGAVKVFMSAGSTCSVMVKGTRVAARADAPAPKGHLRSIAETFGIRDVPQTHKRHELVARAFRSGS